MSGLNCGEFINIALEVLVDSVEKKDTNKIDTTASLSKALGKDLQNGYIIDIEGNIMSESSKEAYEEESIQKFGSNHLVFRIPKSFWWIATQNMKDKSLILLFCGALASLFISLVGFLAFNEKFTYIEGVSIFFAISLIILVSSATEYSQEKIFDRLERVKTDVDVKFIEFGKMKIKKVCEIIVGDLVFFEPGDVMPADSILVSEDSVEMDESLFTGESVENFKSCGDVLYSGSSVQSGSGKAIIILVGKHSSRGKILTNLKKESKKTPLQKKTEELSGSLIIISVIVSILIFIISNLRYAMIGKLTIQQLMKKFLESVALIVTIIPEGLLMATTMALSFGSKRLLKENNLVRDLSACEKMNNVSYLCTDKTGTLTHNKLVLRGYYITKRKFMTLEKSEFLADEDEILKWYLIQNMILNSSAFKNQHGKYIGSKIEGTILKLLEETAYIIEDIRKEAEIIHRQPFISENMYMVVIAKIHVPSILSNFLKKTEVDNDQFFVFFKGAPEKIIQHCKYQIEGQKIVKLNHTKIKRFIHKESKISQIRVSFAFKTISEPLKKFLDLKNSDDLIFSGCFSFEDIVREDIEEKIRIVKQSGIKVVILTGDGPETAKYIAEICGIMEIGDQIITGDMFRSQNLDGVMGKIEKIRVIARATPTDKKIFVELLQKANNIVAVTGDGANDGPALKLADVGFAIGRNASDIAKECSSIVILENDFGSIISAISWGRCINDLIKRFFQLQFTATCATVMIISVISIFSTEESLFSPVSLLWINIYIDTLSAITLTSDRPNERHLLRKPQSLDSPLLTNYMKRFIISNSLWITLVILLLYFLKMPQTFIYNVFFISLISIQICSRTLSSASPFDKILKNPFFLILNFFVVLLHVLFIQKAGKIFKQSPLSLMEWISSSILALTILPLHFFLKKTGLLRE